MANLDPRRLESYDYLLDKNLIATHPISPKSAARLLVYERATNRITHAHFGDFFSLAPKDCLFVLNDTKVLPARLFGRKKSGGKVEILYHNELGENRFLAQVKGRLKCGERVVLEGGGESCGGENGAKVGGESLGGGAFSGESLSGESSQRGGCFSGESWGESASESRESPSRESANLESSPAESFSAEILERVESSLRAVRFFKNGEILGREGVWALLEKYGRTPLPPYIKRAESKNGESEHGESSESSSESKNAESAETRDRRDYQSVFAKNLGSIAAPTASLHFDEDDLAEIRRREHCFITLHIGAGTFFGVESPDITRHKMHGESYFLPDSAAAKINAAKKILCVGTSAARCVEFYAQNGAKSGVCDHFIHPLNPPKKVDFLLTNFHLPKTTLIMLVAAFVGLEKTLEIYEIAKKMGYRFYSYGDAMLVL